MIPQMQIENQMVVSSTAYPYFRPRARCVDCEADIYEGDYYYDFDGDTVCEGCVRDYVRSNFRREA